MKLELSCHVTSASGFDFLNVVTLGNIDAARLAEIAKVGTQLVSHAKQQGHQGHPHQQQHPDPDALKIEMSARVDGAVSALLPDSIVEGVTRQGWKKQRHQWTIHTEAMLDGFDQKHYAKKGASPQGAAGPGATGATGATGQGDT